VLNPYSDKYDKKSRTILLHNLEKNPVGSLSNVLSLELSDPFRTNRLLRDISDI
jgi:hypothetical protein